MSIWNRQLVRPVSIRRGRTEIPRAETARTEDGCWSTSGVHRRSHEADRDGICFWCSAHVSWDHRAALTVVD